ncbi:CLUMA_CG017622, isoform A [Clunio marinus]|uniref:CLUMA_CG017622, isoform A n=1 Tax=Clunio marinus TaxID=568069 RepID=A0A1J1IZF6_9DIPT|nr:CLUMA_CG017622, isoform A [Clunio marinus]
MTIVLDVSFNDESSCNSQNSAIKESSCKKVKDKRHNAGSSKEIKTPAKVKKKNERSSSKKLSSASSTSLSTATTTTSSTSPVSIKDNLIDNKEKLNDLNDQILNSQRHHHHHMMPRTSSAFTDETQSICSHDFRHNYNASHHKSDSIMSSDSDIRFTRKKLGDNQRCGYILIFSFLLMLLISGLIFYAGYILLHQKPLPSRIFRGRIRVIEGDYFIMNYTDQNSIEFFEKAREYRERINLLISRSDFRKYYDGCEILALDGHVFEEGSNLTNKDLVIHFLLNFDAKSNEMFSSVEELRRLFVNEFQSLIAPTNGGRYFKNLKMDINDFQLKEINFGRFDDIFATSSAHVDSEGNSMNIDLASEEIRTFSTRTCEPVKLKFCKQIGYNMTTYPNLLGHQNREEIEKDLIAFREIVDSECFLQAYDFLCHLLQPPCEHALDKKRNEVVVKPRFLCRSYCTSFTEGCFNRIPIKFRPYFDCERFPEQSSIQSCRNKPACVTDLKNSGQGLRICDGIADCPNLEDEVTCSYCPSNALHCGRGRSCVSREMRCDGKFDCPNGADEKDCLSISPLVEYLVKPKPFIPHRPQFFHEGFAVFSEKGTVGKLCAEGMESNEFVRTTVAESLCKALGYERVSFSEIRNDTEEGQDNYVRVLDPRAAEISFVRTNCQRREAFYLGCSHLECGIQSIIASDKNGLSLPKMAMAGDWPFHVALFKKENHVCDGTLVASHWVLTTASCFQGQTKSIWTAVFGNVRIGTTSPWTQKRRIVGMVKSPVEGSTAALVRLQTPVVYSDFVRPICLPDDEFKRNKIATDYAPFPVDSFSASANLVGVPSAEKYHTETKKKIITEDRQYFKTSEDEVNVDDELDEKTVYHYVVASELVDEHMNPIKPEAQYQQKGNFYKTDENILNSEIEHQWKQCNTLGWSRQKEHLQRVQLNLIEMQACENISITTVNSLCAEAAFHKQDCSEEEFAGSPIICLLSDQKRWSLVGVSSWRIACTHSGTERPRMYDRIESNVSWIREIINSVIF